ncbi:cell migration-inducing and hyaluronan-binding protein-like [Branchiostoma floridae]|uniref:Cell migration-inducing and hyaluronan-binding protein-like n=1 Tax=Branchiostoma floridae TaxID=7739 RepID=A0A9J7L876_BRAFL|nr:cell migration-inducing and hyaluronan-binding protein-like [Branchiostoma floridae]
MPSFQSIVNDCSGCGAPGPIVSDDSLSFLELTILSAGWAEMQQQGYVSFIEINGARYDRYYRGFMVIAVDARSGDVTRQMTFDTYKHAEADLDMANFIRNDIPETSIVLVAVRDESSSKAKECLTALKEIGAQEPVKTDYRGNFALVGYKGNVWPTWIQQVNLPSAQGPAQIYTKIPLMG